MRMPFRVDGAHVRGPALVLDMHGAVRRQGHAVARQAGRHHAVEHVHAAGNHLQKLGRRAQPHRITGLVLRQPGDGMVNSPEHLLFRLTHGNASYRIAVKIHGRQFLRAPFSQIRVHGPLNNAEVVLPPFPGTGLVFLHPCLASPRPAERVAQGAFCILPVTGVGRAFVKKHGNIASQIRLYLHGAFRTKHHVRAVQMILETHALLRNLAELRQRPDLEPPGIRQNGTVPGRKTMQPPHFPDQSGTGTERQMIRIPQDNLRAQAFQILGMQRFHGTLRTYGHENRCLHPAMRQFKRTQARVRGQIFLIKSKRHENQAYWRLMKRAK